MKHIRNQIYPVQQSNIFRLQYILYLTFILFLINNIKFVVKFLRLENGENNTNNRAPYPPNKAMCVTYETPPHV